MNSELLFILWNPDLEALRLGPVTVRWYSLCWLVGLALAYFVVQWLFHDQDITVRKMQVKGKTQEVNVFEPLFIYCFLGILIGARLGHCLFYQPEYYLTSRQGFWEMLLPIHFTATGGWQFTGYEGLASHGGTLGLMIALWLYVRWSRLSLWQVLDNIAIATGITACFIRLGNLMNSEIIGRVTDVPWAFIFERVDSMPRHPGQLYEALCYLLLFVIMLWLYARERRRRQGTSTVAVTSIYKPAARVPRGVGSGWYFGFCLVFIFTARFFIEFTKEVQVSFEQGMMLDMGQLLSLPFIALGLWCMTRK